MSLLMSHKAIFLRVENSSNTNIERKKISRLPATVLLWAVLLRSGANRAAE